MNSLRYILVIAGKELQVLSKDRGSLAILFLLPLLLSSLLGSAGAAFYGTSEEGEEPAISLDVILVDEDGGQYATQIANILHDIDELNIETMESATDADKRVAEGEVLGAIILPSDFSQKIDAYQPAEVVVVLDPVKEVGASIIAGIMNQVVGEVTVWGEISYGIRSVFDESGALEDAPTELRRAAEAQSLGAIMTQIQSMRQNPLVTIQSESLSEVEETSSGNAFGFIVPNFTVMFAFFLIGVIAATLLKEKEEGSLRRLIAAPMPSSTIIGGKIAAYMLVIILQVVVLFGIASLAFSMPLGDAPLGLILLTLALALASSSLGMLLAAWAKTSSQADSTGTIVGFILAGLGGCIVTFPRDSFMGNLSLLTPHGHATRAFHDLLNAGSGVVDILPQIGALLGFAVLFFLVAMWQFKFD